MSDYPQAGVNVLQADTTPQFAVGRRARVGLVEYVYVKAINVRTAYMAFVISQTGELADAVTQTVAGARPTRIGVPQVTLSGTSAVPVYGWAAVKGDGFKVAVDNACTSVVAVLVGANAGSLTTIGTGSVLRGLTLSEGQSAAGNAGVRATWDLAVN